jgi:hypothetical protein
LVLSPLSCTSPENATLDSFYPPPEATAGTSPSAYRSRF